MAQSGGGGSTGTVLLALGVNAVIAIGKGVGGTVTGSSALLSEAAHSVADTMNEAFLLTALKRSDRPADEMHPFGYGKERFFWSLMAAMGIFVAGALFSFREAFTAFTSPNEGSGQFLIAYGILAVSLVLEASSLTKAVRQVRREAHQAERGMLDYIRVSDDPTVKTVASEDTAAVAGVLIALAGIGLRQATGNGVYEGVASLLIGILLVYVGFALARDNKGLLIGEAADPRLREQIRQQLAAYDEVDEVLELLTMRIGTRKLLVAVRLDLASDLESDRIEDLSSDIEADLRRAHPAVAQVFLDATRSPSRRRREPAAETS